MARGFDREAAVRHFVAVEPAFAPWIERIGALEAGWEEAFTPVDALARAILFQQLAGKAAATIIGRLERIMPAGPRFCAEDLRDADPQAMRACGVSANKQRALKDLADKALAGVVPEAHALDAFDDAALIARLTAVRGIGRWTVEMLLMFRLGRPDVLPVDDLGVRQGARILLGRRRDPLPRILARIGRRWSPYRTAASMYLWRIVDLARRDAARRDPGA